MRQILLTITFSSIGFISFGQQEIVASSGEHFSSANTEMSFTIGEPIITTSTSQNTTLTQGFQQSNLEITTINEKVVDDIAVDVFPNPVVDLITISNTNNKEGLSVRLMDLNGKVIEYDQLNATKQEYNLSNLQTGVYLVEVLNSENLSIKTFKIIKTH